MSGVICINCEGWGCIQCSFDREAAKGGEQGLTPLEIQIAGLRTEVQRLKEFEANSLSARAWVDLLRHATAAEAEAEGLRAQLAELALLSVPRGDA